MEELSFANRLVFIFFSLLLFMSSSMSHALEPAPSQSIGQVVWVKNTLKAQQPNAEARILTRRSAIYEHDTLTTDSTSSGQVVFTDDSELALQENSSIKIDHYRHGKGSAPSSDAFVVNVIKGGFRTVTGAISKNNPGGYQATTPVATIGVNGTIFSLYFDSIKGSLATKIDQGSITLSNEQGSMKLIKCPGGSAGCMNVLYAEVRGINVAPQAVAAQPAVFNSEPPLTTTTSATKPVDATDPATATSTDPASSVSPANSTQQEKSDVVGSFCIN